MKNLKILGISKNVKSTVSLKVIENLDKLECLYTSISKDIQTIEKLKNLKFLSLREIKVRNLDFISQLHNLNEIWFSLGNYESIDGITNLRNLEKLSLHQIRNFTNEELNSVLLQCKKLKALELQNLINLESLKFLEELRELEYLFLEGNKNLDTYQYIENLHKLKTFSTSNSRPKDQNLDFLRKVENVMLGDSYQKKSIENFLQSFSGKNLLIKGKEMKGSCKNINPFRI